MSITSMIPMRFIRATFLTTAALFLTTLGGVTQVGAWTLGLDPTFGTGGAAIVSDEFIEWESYPRKAVVQPDGKIIVMGINFAYGDFANYFLYRLNADGTNDSSFGSSGMMYYPADGMSAEFFGFGLTVTDGKYTIAGAILDPPYQAYTLGVFRFNSDGSRDAAFGENGVVRTVFEGESAEGLNLRVQPDGKVVVASLISVCDANGCLPTAVAISRLASDGSPDPSFGTNGQLRISDRGLSWAGDLAITSEGKIVATGYCTDHQLSYALRVNPNGTLDDTFGANGISKLGFGNGLGNYAYSTLTLQADGKMVFPVTNRDLTNNALFSTTIVRLNSDGSLDPSFDGDGTVIIPASQGDFADSLVVQRNGRVLAAGATNASRADGPNEFAVIRLDPNGGRDITFGPDGIQTYQLQGLSNFITTTTLQSDGKMIAAGSVRDYMFGALDAGIIRMASDRRKPRR